MNEQTRLFLILAFPFFIFGIYTLFQNLEPEFFVSKYDLMINLERDKIFVNENLTYKLNSNNFRELYRTYNKEGPQADLFVKSFSCPEGAYFKAPLYGTYFELICKNDNFYSKGEHKVSFSYDIPSPYICYDDYCELFWTVMSDFSSNVDNIQIMFNGVSSELTSFPFGKIKGNKILIQTVPKNSLFEVRVLVPRENVEGIYQIKQGNILPEFRKYATYSFFYSFVYNFRFLIILLILCLAVFLLYHLFITRGKEKEVIGAPDVLHYAPSKLKPHEVDFLYSGNIGAFEGNVLDATILDLARRKYLQIGENTIKILKTDLSELDEFEKRIILFYLNNSVKNIFNAKDFNKLVRRMPQFKARNLLNKLNALKSPTSSLFKKLKQVFDTSPKDTSIKILVGFSLFSLISLIVSSVLNWMFVPEISISLLIIFLLWIFVLVKLDDYVFGKYKDDAIEEKVKWDAFKNLLSNYSMMQKYTPKSLSMWGNWLVYATVFGCAKNVVKSMKAHTIVLPNISDPMRLYAMNRLMWHTTRIAATPKSSSRGGFGGGIGGGFGGGGGGAR